MKNRACVFPAFLVILFGVLLCCLPYASLATTSGATVAPLSAWTFPDAVGAAPTYKPYVPDRIDLAYVDLYGFDESVMDFYHPTILHYVNFSRFIARNGGKADGNSYTVHGGVTPANFAEYLAYLTRFGYRIAFDASQGDDRFVELRYPEAPASLPVSFRCYYNVADEALVTVDPFETQLLYDEENARQQGDFRVEIGVEKALTAHTQLTLRSVRNIGSFAIPQTSSPFHPLAASSLLVRFVELPLPVRSLSDGTLAAIVAPISDGLFDNAPHFLLAEVTLRHDGTPRTLSDLQFCINADPLCVEYASQIGTSLREVDGIPFLDTDLSGSLVDGQTLWLVFQMDDDWAGENVQLFASVAENPCPLLQRVHFGLIPTAFGS